MDASPDDIERAASDMLKCETCLIEYVLADHESVRLRRGTPMRR